MGTFSASLRTVGDVTTLPATIEISEGRLTISAGSSEIGSWTLDEISLQEIPTGYRMVAEGDQILIELKDVTSFSTALAASAKKKRGLIGKGGATKSARSVTSQEPSGAKGRVGTARAKALKREVARAGSVDRQVERPRDKRSRSKDVGSSLLGVVDALLIRAKKRFGPYLPEFVFSRAMFFIALVTLGMMAVFPGTFATLLLIAGLLVVVFGAVVYTDSVLASRFLPGRATPQQALILGLGVVLFGILLGALTR